VAESQGKAEDAARFFEQAAVRAESAYPRLAEGVRKRAAQAGLGATEVTLPAQASLPDSLPTDEALTPATIDPWVEKLLAPPVAPPIAP